MNQYTFRNDYLNEWEDNLSLYDGDSIGSVSCGNHYATNCVDCPQGYGASWCNGDCIWIDDQCTETLTTTPSTMLGRYCGETIPPNHISSGNKILLIFHSKYYDYYSGVVARSGFKMNYQPSSKQCILPFHI